MKDKYSYDKEIVKREGMTNYCIKKFKNIEFRLYENKLLLLRLNKITLEQWEKDVKPKWWKKPQDDVRITTDLPSNDKEEKVVFAEDLDWGQ